VRASFWFLFETLQSEELFEDAIQEVSSALKSPGLPPRFDQKKLLQQPLLQSIYAETLRKYVSVMMVRKTRQPSKLAGYNIPAGKKVIVCNYSEHMDEALWKSETNTSRPSSPPPLTQFWGRRFLTSTPDAPGTPVFAAENIGRKWIPFGSGERMCPGRHFTKHQMLLTFALLTETFDIELLSREGERPEPDLTHFGYGTMGPDRSTPFRIRRKGYPVRRDSGAVVY
jgi:cytochrome P450